MGICIPRPAMRRAEARKIRERLELHASLMLNYIAQGMTREDASKEAMQDIKRLTASRSLRKAVL